MTDDASPENLRKFLESDDPAPPLSPPWPSSRCAARSILPFNLV
jgi:hypothetical protein